jgi:putative restriction endonuclease
MAFWWVNHKQTFKEETKGGLIWSPKTNRNGSKNETYDNLPRTRPGDIVFSYAWQKIAAVGVVRAMTFSGKQPEDFGEKGKRWDEEGWLVPIDWRFVKTALVPKTHIKEIAPLLPLKHSPIRQDGGGNQGVYLTAISEELGKVILSLIGIDDPLFEDDLSAIETEIEEEEQEFIIAHSDLTKSEKQQLSKARLGQGIFRKRVEKIESKCRLTGLTDKRFLIASHIIPWKDADNRQRLDGHNGLLLSPHIDRLFDRGWISFEDNGDMLFSDKIRAVLQRWYISTEMNAGNFTASQKHYLAYHREKIFKK